MSDTQKLYTLKDVSEETGFSQKKVKDMYVSYGIATIKVGNAICITEADFKEYFGDKVKKPVAKDDASIDNCTLTNLGITINMGDLEEIAKLCKAEGKTVWVLRTEDNPDGRYLKKADYDYMVEKYADTPERRLATKRKLKNEAKSKVKHKFKVGDLISLKLRVKGGSRDIIKGFKVVKFVYTINNHETNMLILKQISGPKRNIYTLNKFDCKKLHIKYEPGLQVFSMHLNWGKFKEHKSEQ